MDSGRAIAGVVLIGGAWYFLTKSGALAGTGAGLDDLGLVPHEATPAERLRAEALRQPAPGSGPVVTSTPFVTSPGGIAAIGAAGAGVVGAILAPGSILSAGALTGIATAGIGLAVAFVSYELLKQRASMHTNDVRDVWEKQFVELHRALGIRELTAAQTAGSAPGTVEMAEVIFSFDHDEKQTLWHAVQGTQDERAFRAAANNVDAFLAQHGVPVQDVSNF